MDCKSIEKLIPKFIKNECSPKEEEAFLEHIRHCKECKEELTIQLLLEEGLSRLESGASFDLNAELEKRLNVTNRRKKTQRRLLSAEQAAVIIDILGGALILGLIVALLIWKIQ